MLITKQVGTQMLHPKLQHDKYDLTRNNYFKLLFLWLAKQRKFCKTKFILLKNFRAIFPLTMVQYMVIEFYRLEEKLMPKSTLSSRLINLPNQFPIFVLPT